MAGTPYIVLGQLLGEFPPGQEASVLKSVLVLSRPQCRGKSRPALDRTTSVPERSKKKYEELWLRSPAAA